MTRWQLFSLQCTWTSSCGWLTAHGLAGVDLLSHEELLQLPDVHPGLGHVLWVPALRRTAILGGVITCREGRREMRTKGERTKKPVWARPSAERESFLSHLTCWYLNTKWGRHHTRLIRQTTASSFISGKLCRVRDQKTLPEELKTFISELMIVHRAPVRSVSAVTRQETKDRLDCFNSNI